MGADWRPLGILPAMHLPVSTGEAARILRQGGVVAYPTEAVWGLGCDPDDADAVARLLAIKQRDVAKGLILAAAEVSQFDAWLDWAALDAPQAAQVRASWPGPHTWIVPALARVPRWITGQHAGVAVRVSGHPQVAALSLALGKPLVSTSANRAGAPAAFARAELDPSVLGLVDALCEGETGGLDAPTAIRDARTGHVLRA
jgi:L-threonylcarbamoyladenylate synthase